MLHFLWKLEIRYCFRLDPCLVPAESSSDLHVLLLWGQFNILFPFGAIFSKRYVFLRIYELYEILASPVDISAPLLDNANNILKIEIMKLLITRLGNLKIGHWRP